VTAEPTSRAARFLALCNQAAERLGGDTKPSDASAQHLAALLLSQETTVARLVDGENVDADVLLRLDEAIRSAAPPKIPQVKITFVNGSLTQCPACDAEFEPPETGDATCACGHVFVPRSPAETKERKAAAKAAPPKPDGNSSPQSGTVGSSGTEKAPEAKASSSSPAPAARPAPPPPPPPISDTMRAWNRLQGYNRSARDGGLIKGPAVPHVDPNLPGSAARESYNNNLPSCWVGGASNRQWRDPVTPDPNPNFNSDGSQRDPYRSPYDGGGAVRNHSAPRHRRGHLPRV
jgi:hypothetical protein